MVTTRRSSAQLRSVVHGLAANRNSIVGANELRAHGISRSWVHAEIRRGLLHRVLHDTYFVGAGIGVMSQRQWETAAVISCRGVAALSRQSAALRLCGWHRGTGPIHVTSTVDHADETARCIVHHRTRSLPGSDVVLVDGDPATCFSRTVMDLARTSSKFQLANLMLDGSYRGLLDLADLAFRLERAHGHPWTVVVREAIDLFRAGSAGTRSMSEDRFIDAWMRRGFPEPMVNQPDAIAGFGYEADFVWPELRLIVEIDGERAHGHPNARTRDLNRDEALRAAGWFVIRIRASRVWEDLDGCIRDVRSTWHA